MKVSTISGGITNKLKRVEMPAGSSCPSLLVRVFGGLDLIDRDIENPTFEAVVTRFGKPGYYGRFKNGRVEGWLEGSRPLRFNPNDMAEPNTSVQIARLLAKLHTLQLPAELAAFHSTPGLWDQLWEWHKQATSAAAAEKIVSHPAGKQVAALPTSVASVADLLASLKLEDSAAELKALQESIPASAPVAFCHNDLLAGNIMRDDSNGAITFIDFEYGGSNYRGFDIANHFNEWAGGTEDGEPDYTAVPTDAQRKAFCSAYLAELADQAGGGSRQEQEHGQEEEEGALKELLAEAAKFELVNHWYWGLWAVVQAADEGFDVFPYLTYASRRIGQYRTLLAK